MNEVKKVDLNNHTQILSIGYGEIGKSICGLYDDKKEYDVWHIDTKDEKKDVIPKKIDIMHVCIQYSEKFIQYVREYIEEFKPGLTIINSTVPVMTTDTIYNVTKVNIVHSPVMGKHPNLTKSIQTFTKIVAGCTKEATEMACSHFSALGINTMTYDTPEESEMAKLLSTSYYAWSVYYMQKVHNLCKKWNLDFDNVYTKTNHIYNEGYSELGDRHFVRPVLRYMGKGVGKHCLYENAVILLQSNMLTEIVKPIVALGKAKSNS